MNLFICVSIFIFSTSKNKATEVELSGNFKKAAQRLKDSGKPQKVLQVRQGDMKKAEKAMKEVGVGGTVKNMGGRKRKSVPKPKKK